MTEEDWTAWNEERERFRKLGTQGWEQDMINLRVHIKRLIEVAPKDNAGWMNGQALEVINLLTKQRNLGKVWRGQMP